LHIRTTTWLIIFNHLSLNKNCWLRLTVDRSVRMHQKKNSWKKSCHFRTVEKSVHCTL
jgi:hypothetical protein